ncbi:winged helix-turn-helix domain-containing protein [Luteipulveratus flavus]|uniref:Helix-turn-helix domain-containing protein n=1 Tax=Luteipulveratus flavus TaxID=3031728 RepID=A0ABT6C9E8_9MICO|nr:helix-turn-helix domain-containing protein [Luteipulveratus sp. YIM 133296]MDF8265537.1 helix-turn-helix domain-containing protein [Luteipulveratus sp. YIM 133296]
MSDAELDPVLQDPVRRRICAALILPGPVERPALQRLLALPDATLADHLDALGEAGYLEEQDGRVGLTESGRAALVTYEAERDRLERQLRENDRPYPPVTS